MIAYSIKNCCILTYSADICNETVDKKEYKVGLYRFVNFVPRRLIYKNFNL